MVKRWDLGFEYTGTGRPRSVMEEAPDGNFVRWSDVGPVFEAAVQMERNLACHGDDGSEVGYAERKRRSIQRVMDEVRKAREVSS